VIRGEKPPSPVTRHIFVDLEVHGSVSKYAASRAPNPELLPCWRTMCASIYAHDFEDAEARCKLLNMKLEGHHMATIQCMPTGAPVAGPLVGFVRRIKNTVVRSNMEE
jgi:hypothetical protein